MKSKILGLGLLLTTACGSGQKVEVLLVDRCDHQLNGAMTEFVVTAADACGEQHACAAPLNADLLLGKMPDQGVLFHASVPVTEPLPAIGKLEKGNYNFTAIVRDAQCNILGVGCTCADLASVGQVKVQPLVCDAERSVCTCGPVPGSGCASFQECVAGECVGPDGGSGAGQEPAGDSACELQVVASGALPEVTAATQVFGPAIASTPEGFVLAYQTQDEAGALNEVLAPLPSADGTLSVAPGAGRECPDAPHSGGIGMGYATGGGLAVFSVPDCDGSGAGVLFTDFDAGGSVGAQNAFPNDGFSSLSLAPSGVISKRPGAGEWDFVFRVINTVGLDQTQVGTLKGAGFTGGLSPLFDDADYAMTARGDSILGFLGSFPDHARLKVGTGLTELAAMADVSLPALTVATMAATQDQLLVATNPESGPGIQWNLYSSDGQDSGAQVVGDTSYGSGVAAWFADKPLVVAGGDATIDVHWIGGDDALLSLGASHGVKGFSGGHLAAAAGSDELAMVWLNSATVETGALGGWARVKCVTPEATGP